MHTFIIYTKTLSGEDYLFGDASVSVTISGHSYFSVFDNFDGSYTVTYEQELTGKFFIYVKIDGVNIRGSPFHLTAV